jgi:hypothetical protein
VDPFSAVALGLVALAVTVAVWRHRRGGLHLDVRLWWGDRDPGDETGTTPGHEHPSDE